MAIIPNPPRATGCGSEGTSENSPAFQCRVRLREIPSPAGTAEHFFRPCGTRGGTPAIPALKRRAIFKLSRRDPTYDFCGRKVIAPFLFPARHFRCEQ
jgi:hypothetical protein